jgi:hypothetical protein
MTLILLALLACLAVRIPRPLFFRVELRYKPGVDRREINRAVQGLLPCMGGAAPLLDAVAGAMRGERRVPAGLSRLLKSDDALGQVYQAINAPALEAAYRGTARERRKFAPGEIPAVTQLFTPKWVVAFLLQNTLGKLWLEWHPRSPLRKKWNWICGEEVPCEVAPKRTRDLRICDPACGTMNFGLVAIDMLRDIYRNEGKTDDREIDGLIVSRNLIGFDIDPTAIELARRSMEIKIGRGIGDEEHLLSLRDALFDESSTERYDVIVTNPPYLSARNLDARIVARLKKRYRAGWRDLYASFVLRAMELLAPGGRAGVLSMHSFMFTAAFENLRREILSQSNVESVAHFGPGLFDIGNPGTLQTAAIVLRRKPATEVSAVFFRLVDAEDKSAALREAIDSQKHFQLDQPAIAALPRAAWMYWISPDVRRAFETLPTLAEIAPPRQGLATTDNARFVRYWWEVEAPGFDGPREKWKPYAKGGRFRRWYERARHRVNWEDDGREIKAAIVARYPYLDGQWQWVAKNSAWYGREGITYSYLTSAAFSARRLEAGTIFDVAGSSLFPDDALAVLGVLNSKVARHLLAAINPTVNFQVGDLRQLPMPRSLPDELRNEVSLAIECTRQLDQFDETCMDFVRPEPWVDSNAGDLRSAIDEAESRIHCIVAELYGIDEAELEVPQQAEKSPAGGKEELARRWISYALGVWLGRWGNATSGTLAMLRPLSKKFRREIVRILCEFVGDQPAAEIVAVVAGLERFFARDFHSWHNRLYRDRPVIWALGSAEKIVAVSSLNADADVMGEAFAALGERLPPGWRRWVDDGVRINLAPLRQWIVDRQLRLSVGEVETDLREGRFRFSQTSQWMRAINRGSNGESAPTAPRNPTALAAPAGR